MYKEFAYYTQSKNLWAVWNIHFMQLLFIWVVHVMCPHFERHAKIIYHPVLLDWRWTLQTCYAACTCNITVMCTEKFAWELKVVCAHGVRNQYKGTKALRAT